MAVVKIRTFFVSISPHPISQGDLDTVAASANVFLATLAAVNVLAITSEFAPGGKNDIRSSYVITVVYLE